VTSESPSRSFDGLRVVFERGGELREHPLARLGEHATVHAMTIHKSQGSQFDEVVVVLPDEASRLLTRELLYTAVTRASSGCGWWPTKRWCATPSPDRWNGRRVSDELLQG
jgi:ATP-dependent exoDNAse (exonuclease V) alpha subunit